MSRCISLFILLVPSSPGTAYHWLYVRPVPDRARVHYPFHAIPDVNSAPPFLTVNTISVLTVNSDMHGVITLSLEYTLWDEEEDNICWIMTVTSLFNGNKNSLKII